MTQASDEIRERLLRIITEFPGLHLRELARQADTSEALAGYHLDALEKEGLVQAQERDAYRRFFSKAAAPSDDDRELIALLRQRVPLQVALLLLDRKNATQHELATELDLAKSTVSYHAARLQTAGLVRVHAQGGLELVDPRRVRRLITKWSPPPSLTDRFESLWSDFFSSPKKP